MRHLHLGSAIEIPFSGTDDAGSRKIVTRSVGMSMIDPEENRHSRGSYPRNVRRFAGEAARPYFLLVIASAISFMWCASFSISTTVALVRSYITWNA